MDARRERTRCNASKSVWPGVLIATRTIKQGGHSRAVVRSGRVSHEQTHDQALRTELERHSGILALFSTLRAERSRSIMIPNLDSRGS